MEQNKEPPSEEGSPTIEKEKVLLKRTWTFWENYQSKDNAEKDYSKLLKEIYTFNDIISFWQFWNNYPGNNIKTIFYNGDHVTYFFKEKYRIIAMNLFVKGIKPAWEDEQNKKGKTFILEYNIRSDLNSFLNKAQDIWIKMICHLLGEIIPFSNNIHGIRFVDKAVIGKKTVFRFEIWVNKFMKENELNELKQFLSTTFEHNSITVKDIP
jgi:hypothetical protein